jgi:hypothetical protein
VSIVSATSTTSWRWRGDGQVVETEHALCQRPHHRPDRHAHHGGRHHPADARHHLHERIGAVGIGCRWRRLLAERRGELGEQGPVRIERLGRPLATGDHARLGEQRVEAGDVVHVHRRDLRQVDVRHPHLWVDVGFGLALRGPEERELAGGVPVERTLTLQQTSEVAEHREGAERVRHVALVARTRSWYVGHVSRLGGTGRDRAACAPCGRSSVRSSGRGSRRSAVASGSVALDERTHPAVPVDPVARSGRRRVYVRGAGTGIGRRVVDGLRSLDDADAVEVVVAPAVTPVHPSMGPCDVLVDVAIADHDLLGRRGESVTAGVAGLLADADALGVAAIVVVSSAMVYGAIANNPVPLTEDAVLRPDPSFVYARQLASAEALVEAWRVARPPPQRGGAPARDPDRRGRHLVARACAHRRPRPAVR